MMCAEEDDQADSYAYHGVCEDFHAFARRCFFTWAVWAECNPVCCVYLVSKPLLYQSTPAALCNIMTSEEVVVSRVLPAFLRHSCPLLLPPDTEAIGHHDCVNLPAFFSCNVISFQSTFIRSLNAIHRSACSWGGMASHLFSIFARVGLLIACAFRVCCCCIDWQRDASGVRAAAWHLEVVRVVADASCRSRGCERSIVGADKVGEGRWECQWIDRVVYQDLRPARTCRRMGGWQFAARSTRLYEGELSQDCKLHAKSSGDPGRLGMPRVSPINSSSNAGKHLINC